MAARPVFIPDAGAPGVRVTTIDFEWSPGFSAAQKQKSVRALHSAAGLVLGVDTNEILEVSSKSEVLLGTRLSAFSLRVPSIEAGGAITVEAAFQGSKIYEYSGRHPEWYRIADAREVKKRAKELASERVVGFEADGVVWTTEPTTAFYDWIYIAGLRNLFKEQPEAERELLGYSAFTDIEFNPGRSFNCQARACALYVSSARLGLVNELSTIDRYRELIGIGGPGRERPVIEPLSMFDPE